MMKLVESTTTISVTAMPGVVEERVVGVVYQFMIDGERARMNQERAGALGLSPLWMRANHSVDNKQMLMSASTDKIASVRGEMDEFHFERKEDVPATCSAPWLAREVAVGASGTKLSSTDVKGQGVVMGRGRKGPRRVMSTRVQIKGHWVFALVDSGVEIAVLRGEVARALKLTLKPSCQAAVTAGTTTVQAASGAGVQPSLEKTSRQGGGMREAQDPPVTCEVRVFPHLSLPMVLDIEELGQYDIVAEFGAMNLLPRLPQGALVDLPPVSRTSETSVPSLRQPSLHLRSAPRPLHPLTVLCRR